MLAAIVAASPTGNSLVKDEIDIQSGRVEFLKQSLTLSLAGIAGAAVLFTDPSRIPVGTTAIIASYVVGFLLLATAGAAYMGLSTYANLLRNLGSTSPDPEPFRKSLVRHSRYTFALIALSALSIAGYAVARVNEANRSGRPTPVTAQQALDTAIRTATSSRQPLRLAEFSQDARTFVARFDVQCVPVQHGAHSRDGRRRNRTGAARGHRTRTICAQPAGPRTFVVRVAKLSGELQSISTLE